MCVCVYIHTFTLRQFGLHLLGWMQCKKGILYRLTRTFYNKNTEKLLEQKQLGMSFATWWKPLIHGTGGLLRVVYVVRVCWARAINCILQDHANPSEILPRKIWLLYKLIIYTLKSLSVEHFYSNNLLATGINIVMLSQKTVLIKHWKRQRIWKYLTWRAIFPHFNKWSLC